MVVVAAAAAAAQNYFAYMLQLVHPMFFSVMVKAFIGVASDRLMELSPCR